MSSPSSLFSAPDSEDERPICTASRETPPIPGLYVFPALLPDDISHEALMAIGDADHFVGGTRDQVMLFTAAPTADIPSTLPGYVTTLLSSIRRCLEGRLSGDVHDIVFKQDLARQVILNLYPLGQGISPHIDLPSRYADGILGVSLVGGTVMAFAHPDGRRHDVLIPERSVYVLSGESRWDWTHGIEGRTEDEVVTADGRSETLLRGLRVSVTFRWMKAGAEVLS